MPCLQQSNGLYKRNDRNFSSVRKTLNSLITIKLRRNQIKPANETNVSLYPCKVWIYGYD